MKIALYYPWIYLKSGVERTILETVKRSRHSYTIFTNHYDREGTYPEFKKLEVNELERIPVRRNIWSVVQASIIILFQKIDLQKFDLLLVHSEGLGDLILPRNNKIPTICFCHTPLRPVFDTEYKIRSREKESFVRKTIYQLLDFLFQITDKVLWKKYNYIFFNSMESLKRAKKGRLLSKSAKYEILHPGIDWKNIKPTYVFRKYFLLPGRIMWTKNIELAIDNFILFEKRLKGNSFKLIIAGQVDKKSAEYFARLKLFARKSKNIYFVTNPSDKRLNNLYADCYAVLATSFNEDWGLTPIEANAHGKPVLAVKKGGFKESQINGVTGYLTDGNKGTLAESMYKLATDAGLTRKLGISSRNNAKRYDWELFISVFDHRINNV
jgi:glycosyltransferase involved in cell wall biosynthesis